jgi:hypothetical protein
VEAPVLHLPLHNTPGWHRRDLVLLLGTGLILLLANVLGAYSPSLFFWGGGGVARALWSALCVAILVTAIRRRISLAELGLAWPRTWWPILAIIGRLTLYVLAFSLILCVSFAVIGALGYSPSLGSDAPSSRAPPVIFPQDGLAFAAVALNIITREFFYRGFLLGVLEKRIDGTRAAVACALPEPLLFPLSLPWLLAMTAPELAVLMVVMGASFLFTLNYLLAWGRLRSGSLVIPLVAGGLVVLGSWTLLSLLPWPGGVSPV